MRSPARTPRRAARRGPAPSCVVHHVGRVVGVARLLLDETGLEPRRQRGRDELVVDAPADVVGTRRAAVAPPGVVLAFRMQAAVAVDPAAVVAAHVVEPLALGRQAAGILLVAAP